MYTFNLPLVPWLSLLWLLFYTKSVLASLDMDEDEAAIMAKVSTFGTICESSMVWTLLTQDPTVTGVQNIEFGKIEAITKAQIQKYEFTIANKKKELELLLPRIQAAEAKQQVKPLGSKDLEALIEAGLAPFKSDKTSGIDRAKKTGCGDPKKRDRSVRGKFNECRDNFDAVVKTKLNGKLFDGDEWDAVFKKKVGEDGYCPQLNQVLRSKAAKGGAKPYVPMNPDLNQKAEELKQTIQQEEEKLGQCKAASKSMAEFKSELEERKGVYNVRHEDLRRAENDLFDAQGELEDSLHELEENKEELEKAKQQLTSKTKDVTDAKALLDKVVAEETKFKASLEKTEAELELVQKKISAAKRGDEVVEELRSAVSVTCLKMRLYFEGAALKPVEEAGLSGSTDLNQYFLPLEKVPAYVELDEKIGELTSFCQAEALPAFVKVKQDSGLDLTPLCPAKEKEKEMKADIQKLMKSRIDFVRTKLETVKSWFNPFKGQNTMSKKEADTRKAAGEPEGLREIVGAFSDAKFYQYLKQWMLKGKFLPLIAQLGSIVVDLSQSFAKLTNEAKIHKQNFAGAQKARQDAQQKLEKAVKAQGIAKQEKDALESVVAKLKEQTAEMAKQEAEYQAKVDLALKELEKAKQQLLAAHKAGTSLMDGEWDEEVMSAMLD